MRQSYGDLRKCYVEGLTTNPTLAGKLVVRLVIGADGTVKHVERHRDTTLRDARAVSCMIDRFRRLTFPSPGAELRIDYPVNFTPDDDEPAAR